MIRLPDAGSPLDRVLERYAQLFLAAERMREDGRELSPSQVRELDAASAALDQIRPYAAEDLRIVLDRSADPVRGLERSAPGELRQVWAEEGQARANPRAYADRFVADWRSASGDRGAGETTQVEDRAERPAGAGGDVAELAAGGVDRHDRVAGLVGLLHAGDLRVEVLAEPRGLGLLAEDLAEHVGLPLELGVERLALARVEVEEGCVRGELLELVLVLGEALAVDDEVGLGGDDRLEVGLAVGAEVDDVRVLRVLDRVGHEAHRGGGELDVPVGEGLEGPVVRRDDGARLLRHLLGAVVVLDRDGRARRGVGVGRSAGGQGEGETADEGQRTSAAEHDEVLCEGGWPRRVGHLAAEFVRIASATPNLSRGFRSAERSCPTRSG